MTVVDLHPEDLLDRDARGELNAAEEERLEAHLARCSACRAERLLRSDFSAELEDGERPSAILGLVAGALKSAKAEADAEAAKREPEVVVEEPLPPVAGLRRKRRGAFVMLCAAAALLAASAAGATGIGARVWKGLRGDAPELTHANLPDHPAPVVTVAATPVVPVAATAVAAPVEEPEDTPAPAPTFAARVTLPSAQPVSFTAPSFASATPSASNAAAMFDAANTARRTGDVATALRLYDDLEQRYPTSREARSAKATTGRLLLDRGDANGAARRFDAYLATGATELREEAMAGRATALERMGRDEEESSAWALLLATYPHTPYAAHARARIARSVTP